MRILLDANVFTYQEADHVLSENLQELLKILSEAKADVVVHPSSLDERRKEVMSSKIGMYPFLETPPNPKGDIEYMDMVRNNTGSDDEISNIILYSLHKDAADFLITEDRGIHKKASKLGSTDRVLLIDEALQIFKNLYIGGTVVPPALKNEFVKNLNYDDPIFDSLKEEYHPEFGSWFKKISLEGRKSWVYYRKDGSLGALLIYKLEDEPIDSDPLLPKKKRLKIATLKVTHIGHKIGELFIKMATDLSVRNNIYEIYLTHFTRPSDQLIELITEYGFDKVAVKDNGEEVYVKKLVTDGDDVAGMSPIEISKRFYPSFYDGNKVKKFIVPIRPEYHNKLFTDFPWRQPMLSEYSGEFIIEGNTIKKAYLSHSRIKKMSPEDLILFYRSGDLQAVTSIGVVEAVYTGLRDRDQILKLTGKRTVFSREDINALAEDPISIFLFRHHLHLDKPLTLEKLVDSNVLAAHPQSATEISDERYIKLKNIGGINERLTIH